MAKDSKSKELKSKQPKSITPESDEDSYLYKIRLDKRTAIWVACGLVITAIAAAVTIVVSPLIAPQQVSNTIDDFKQTVTTSTTQKEKLPTVLPRRVDGLIVARNDANLVPACVMIENAAFDGVRPQSGLSAASLVYEIIVEGGITRLMAVYAGEHSNVVGPVRSARDTYLEFASELNCAYTHAGGSYTAMEALSRFDMRDIDGLREGKWFWRDSSKVSPHNLFTSTDNLYTAITDGHSWTEETTFDMWNFVDELSKDTIGASETANEVNIEFGGSYNVNYTYNTTEGYYVRKNAGVDHIDAVTGTILTTRNIVIQTVPPGELIEGKGRINFSVTGEGDAYIFRNGILTKGRWSKPDRLSRTQYMDLEGNHIEFVRGNTWVEIVPDGIGYNWQ